VTVWRLSSRRLFSPSTVRLFFLSLHRLGTNPASARSQPTDRQFTKILAERRGAVSRFREWREGGGGGRRKGREREERAETLACRRSGIPQLVKEHHVHTPAFRLEKKTIFRRRRRFPLRSPLLPSTRSFRFSHLRTPARLAQ